MRQTPLRSGPASCSTKTIHSPSEVIVGFCAFSRSVTWRGEAPSASAIQIWKRPVRSELNRSFRPSGENAGSQSEASWSVSRRSSPLVRSKRQMSRLPLRSELNRIDRPSGV